MILFDHDSVTHQRILNILFFKFHPLQSLLQPLHQYRIMNHQDVQSFSAVTVIKRCGLIRGSQPLPEECYDIDALPQRSIQVVDPIFPVFPCRNPAFSFGIKVYIQESWHFLRNSGGSEDRRKLINQSLPSPVTLLSRSFFGGLQQFGWKTWLVGSWDWFSWEKITGHPHISW